MISYTLTADFEQRAEKESIDEKLYALRRSNVWLSNVDTSTTNANRGKTGNAVRQNIVGVEIQLRHFLSSDINPTFHGVLSSTITTQAIRSAPSSNIIIIKTPLTT